MGGLFALLEGILYQILLGNVANRRILSTDSSLTLYPLEPFGKCLCRGHGSKILS
jgi:hypothetical protein